MTIVPISARTAKSAVKSRDQEGTRLAILDAAEVEFARAGLAGARTETIADISGANRALIYYYFDSKEKLYQAVLERFVRARVEAIQQINLNDTDMTKALAQFIREWVAQCQTNVGHASIMFFEALQNRGSYYKEIALAAIYKPLDTILKRGIEQGAFRQMNTLHVAINILGILNYYFCMRDNVKHLFPPETDLLSDVEVEKHLDEALLMVLNGLKA